MIFADRTEAGHALADEVARLLGPIPRAAPLVLALPRGGVLVAAPVARRVGGELDVVVARKIGAPGQPEFGVGALAEDGSPIFDTQALRAFGHTADDLAGSVDRERGELHRRIRRYRGDRPAPQVAGRTVVLVDDGLATGVTAYAASRWIRDRRPGRLILAVPVCSPPARDVLAGIADTVVCLHAPPDFHAVGQWYVDFDQVEDAQVDRVLNAARAVPARGSGPPAAG